MRVAIPQTSFTAGELSPLMGARSDTSLYRAGAMRLENFALLAQGGVRTRPGTRWLRSFTGLQAPNRLVAYEFSPTQTYVLAFAEGRLVALDRDGELLAEVTGAPWTAAMLPQIAVTYTGDTIIVCHPDMPPQIIRRTGAASFTVGAMEFESTATRLYQPYRRYAPVSTTLTPSGTSGSITVTASAAAFDEDQVGDIFRIGGKEIEITAVASATSATATVRETLDGTSETTDWDEPAWSDFRGWPRSPLFFDGRLWFGGARSAPSGLWASKVGAFFNFDLGSANDDEAIAEGIGGERVSEVRHLVGHRHLQVFCDTGEYYVPSSEGRPITPTSIALRQQTPYGCGLPRPQPFDGASLFADRNGKVVREYLFVDTEQAYISPAVSLLSPHLIRSPVELAVLYGGDSYPEQYALLINEDGTMAVFHSVRAEKIAGWVPWTTQGKFRSICVLAGEIFVTVEREVGGAPVFMLERFDDTAILDAARTAPVNDQVAAGFDHLAGETIEVVFNDYYLGQQAVAGDGSVTLDGLDPVVAQITGGWWFGAVLTPMPVDLLSDEIGLRGRKKRLRRVVVSCAESMSFRVDGDAVMLSFAGDDLGTDSGRVDGDIEFRLLGWTVAAQFDLRVVDPGQITVLGITREVEVNG